MNARTALAELMGLLDEQLELYRGLEQLARGQRDMIAKEDSASLLGLLGDRQKLVDRLMDLTERRGSVYRTWEENRDQVSSADRASAELKRDQIGETLQRIMELDRGACEALAARRNSTGQALVSMGRGQQAVRAYQDAAGKTRQDAPWGLSQR